MDAVKLVDITKGLIEGWAIPFGGPMPGNKDLDGEAFTKETELYLDAYPSRPLLYHHGLDVTMGFAPIGSEVKAMRKEGGIWLEAQMNLAGQYKDLLMELLGNNMLGFSSGANPHSIAKTSGGVIKSWLWMETSLTPTPSNPYALVASKSGGVIPTLVEQHAMLTSLGHLPDAGEVAVWMAEKAQKDPDGAALQSRLEKMVAEALDLERRKRDQESEVERLQRENRQLTTAAELGEARRENARIMEAANVTS